MASSIVEQSIQELLQQAQHVPAMQQALSHTPPLHGQASSAAPCTLATSVHMQVSD